MGRAARLKQARKADEPVAAPIVLHPGDRRIDLAEAEHVALKAAADRARPLEQAAIAATLRARAAQAEVDAQLVELAQRYGFSPKGVFEMRHREPVLIVRAVPAGGGSS
jgi:hypothetical protein